MLPKTLLPFFWHFIKKQPYKFALAQIGSLAWTLEQIGWPIFFMYLVDTFTKHIDNRYAALPELIPILIGGVLLWITVDIGFRLGGITWAQAIPKMEADVRMSIFDYVQRHSYGYFSNQFTGTLANKISDMPPTMTHILQLVITLFVPVLIAIFIAVVLFLLVNPIFAILISIWIILHVGICLWLADQCDYLSLVHAESKSVLAGKIVDSLSNHLNVRLFARYKDEKHFIFPYQNKEVAAHWNSLWYIEKIKIFLALLSFLFPGVLLTGYIVYAWLHNHLTTGEVIFVLNSAWNIMMMVWFAGMEVPNLFKEIGVAKQALSLIQFPHDIVDAPLAKELIVTRGEIKFDHVTFHYTPGRSLFKDKTLVIKPREKVGLVGLSGSGKTSFIQLILRHFEVEKGRILIDDQDIAKVTLDSLRRAIALIPQEPILFHRTIMENIGYGDLNASDEMIYEASMKAHCHDFIMKLEDGYQTLVGERGVKLSGGQRQRIAIARAILKNAPILILDEATSSLDSVTERHIQQDLAELMGGRTCIVVAHRLSTISSMDRILVFDHGEVVEEGKHEELLAEEGLYANMWQMQAGGFLAPEIDEGEE